MILSVLRVAFLTLMGLVVAWAAFLLLPSVRERVVASDEGAFRNAFPSGAGGVASDRAQPNIVPVLWDLPFLGEGHAVRQAEAMLIRRVGMASSLSPLFLTTLGVSFLAGALVRERLRLGTTYASPSVSFLSKRVVECALVLVLVWVFSPAPIPYVSFLPLLLAAAVGTVGWVGNLPLRL